MGLGSYGFVMTTFAGCNSFGALIDSLFAVSLTCKFTLVEKHVL